MTESQTRLSTTTTNADLSAERALRARGVVAARQLAQSATPDLIGAWCDHFDRQAQMGPGALVAAIRSGAKPPRPKGPRTGERTPEERRRMRERLQARRAGRGQ